MSFFYSLTFFVLTLGILYLVLNHRFSKLLDQKFDELYSKKVRADMQEFYREMETYSLIFDNKIKSFKNLIEKQQEQLLHWQEIINVLKKSKNGKELAQFISRARKKDEQMMQILTQMSALSQNSLQKVDEKIKAPAITNEGEEIPARQSPSNASLNKAHKAIEAMAQNTPTELPEKVRTSTTTSTLGTASIGSRSADPKNVAPQSAVKEKSISASSPQNSGDVFTKILKTLVKAVAPGIAQSEANLRRQVDEKIATNAQPVVDFQSKLRQATGAPQQDVVETNSLEDDPVYQSLSFDDEGELPANPRRRATMTEATPVARLNPQDLLQLLKKLQRAAERPQALSNLLHNGFEITQIAELAQMSVGELELTRKIHNL